MSEGQNESSVKEERSARPVHQELSGWLQSFPGLGHCRNHQTHVPAFLLTWVPPESYKMINSIARIYCWVYIHDQAMATLVFQPQGSSIHRWEENVSFQTAAALNHFITSLVRQLAVLQPEGTTDLMKETWLLYQKVFTKALTFVNAHTFPHSARARTKRNQRCIWKCVYIGSQITAEFAETATCCSWWTGFWYLKLYQATIAASREGRE